MLGKGIYFADVFDKSMQYTDVGRFNKNKGTCGFLGLFELYMDRVLSGNPSTYTSYSKIKKEYNMFFAKKGKNSSLVDNEYCVYKKGLYVCKYLVEIKNIGK